MEHRDIWKASSSEACTHINLNTGKTEEFTPKYVMVIVNYDGLKASWPFVETYHDGTLIAEKFPSVWFEKSATFRFVRSYRVWPGRDIGEHVRLTLNEKGERMLQEALNPQTKTTFSVELLCIGSNE